MTAPDVLHAAMLARLQTMAHVTVYDADVPSKPPADSQGRVYPYAVLWPSPGGAPSEGSVAGPAGLEWVAQVTVAAGTPTWCLQAASKVRAVLAGHVLVAGDGPLVEDTPPTMPLTRDEDVTPPRWYVPLLWRCLTP